MGEGRSKWGKFILINAAVAAWLIYDMASATETPRQAVMILQYVFLTGVVVGLVGATVKYLSAE